MASSATREATAGPPTTPSSSRTLGFLDLPQEVQNEIIKHCSTRDLICVALVSKHFRDLAAAELYREFSIVFPDEDNPQFDTPVDSLAGGFDTFVTSDYNYAQYLKSLCFDTLYMGDKAEVAYRPYLANLSCGKFMNTLLLLTLRKAKALESFKWNIRVELSRPVYKELHQIPALSHLHIRLQAGPSQYETPPPLPYTVSHSTASPGPVHIPPISSLPPPPPSFGLIPPPGPQGFYIPASSVHLPPLPKPPRARAPKKASSGKEPPTLSGFKKLKSLAVLDIDTLDMVPELQACVRNSAGTLSKLKLSFSEQLASSARKPSADPESEDSDQEDEIEILPPVHNEEMSGPARAFRAQEEKKAQESVLGRIFDVESIPARKPTVVSVENKDKEKKGKAKTEQELVDVMKSVATKFLGELNGTRDFQAPQDVIDMIGAATQKYFEEAKAQKEKQDENSNSPDASDADQPSNDKGEEASGEASGSAVSLFSNAAVSNKAREGNRDASPDDINIEDPEEQLDIEPGEPPATESEPASTDLEAPAAAVPGPRTESEDVSAAPKSKALEEACAMGKEIQQLAKEIEQWQDALKKSTGPNELADADLWLKKALRNVQSMQERHVQMQNDLNTSHKAVPDSMKSSLPNGAGTSKEPDQQADANMREYLRETRGVALESLSIYLIPVKASVLSRAVDLRTLRRLTLLNVGVQAPIWALLHKENKESPLPLRKIFTDNVSLVFLNFVASLPEVHELFMLERENKAKPESFAPKTQTTIDQIRRLVLKKHLPRMRRLMIKNLSGTAWDVNEKAILLLCRQGRRLEELACNMSIRAMHCLMQHISGLSSLRALHVVHLRNDDTCMWVMRETKRFLIDNVSHYPDLPLEYIAIDEDDRVDQLVRVSDWMKKATENNVAAADSIEDKKMETMDTKGKGKQLHEAVAIAAGSVWDWKGAEGGADVDISAVLAAAGLGVEGGESSSSSGGGGVDGEEGDGEETDGEDEDGSLGQKIEVMEAIPFYEVVGVRIFKKEIVAGRL